MKISTAGVFRIFFVVILAEVIVSEVIEVSPQAILDHQTVDLPAVTRAEVFLLGEIEDDAGARAFPIRPYNEKAPILDEATLRGEKAESLASLWRSRSFDGGGAMCHVPLYGLRLYSRNKLVLETSLCWKCNNCFLAKGSGGHRWQGLYDNDYALLRHLRDILIPSDPIRAEIGVMIGSSLFIKESHAEAIAELSSAIGLDSKNSDAYFWRSKAYAEQGKFKRAISDMASGIELAPRWRQPFLLSLRAEMLSGIEEHEKAIQDLSRGITIALAEGDHPHDLYLQRANLYDELGKTSEAAQDHSAAESP